jgi:hypothetical protein
MAKVNGIDEMNMAFGERLDQYRDGLISKGEYFNALVVLITNEAAKYQAYLDHERKHNDREQFLLAAFMQD